jgi:tetratricopeptide (TPR) repeat protein
MRTMFVVLAGLFLATACPAESYKLSDWTKLIDKKDSKAAKALCTKFVDSQTIAEQVEAHKCLANVVLCENSTILLEGDNAGGGTLRGSYTPDAVNEALSHLNAALKLAPQDLSIHMGRLHLFEESGRYDDMVKALDESCGIYKGKEAPSAWIQYSPEFADLRQYEAGLEFSKILDKHYPNSPDILGNIGAFLNLLKRDQEAIPYLEKAAELAPKDAINAWDLGRAYDYTNENRRADEWYQKGLSLMSEPAQIKESRCLYAHFIENKLGQPARACSMEKQYCGKDERTACGVANGHSHIPAK